MIIFEDKNEEINNKNVYVDKDTFKALCVSSKLELISLSRMTQEEITNNLTPEETEIYLKAMEN